MTVSEYTTVRTLQYGASLALARIQDDVMKVADTGIQIKNQSGMTKRERTFTHLSL